MFSSKGLTVSKGFKAFAFGYEKKLAAYVSHVLTVKNSMDQLSLSELLTILATGHERWFAYDNNVRTKAFS